ncbi:MAG: AIM24 family protein [Verrucomicrobiales bacterium]|nr:AIM24 family protein [Verrucomicrobiales bacterium]
MANFEIIEQEGVRLVKVTLKDEAVRTESGALYYMRGAILMESKAPSLGGFLKSIATGEKVFRPIYTGTGELYLEPSLGGFHIFDCGGATWIAENGAYWASEVGVVVDLHREKALTSLKSGEGFLDYQTKLSGEGKVVLAAQGPVETIQLNDEKLVVDGNYVLARTGAIHYSAQRATKSLFGSLTSGEGFVRIYEGTGTLLMAPMPYWRHRLFASMASLRAGAGGGPSGGTE